MGVFNIVADSALHLMTQRQPTSGYLIPLGKLSRGEALYALYHGAYGRDPKKIVCLDDPLRITMREACALARIHTHFVHINGRKLDLVFDGQWVDARKYDGHCDYTGLARQVLAAWRDRLELGI